MLSWVGLGLFLPLKTTRQKFECWQKVEFSRWIINGHWIKVSEKLVQDQYNRGILKKSYEEKKLLQVGFEPVSRN